MRYHGISNVTRERTQLIYPYVWQDNIFTPDELKQVAHYCAFLDLKEGIIGHGVYSPDKRRARVNMFYPNEQNRWIFERLNNWLLKMNESYYGFAVNGYDFIQYSEYTKEDEGHFGWHVDLYWGGDPPPPPDMFEPRKLSMSLLLNTPGEDFEGGEFEYAGDDQRKPVNVPFVVGRAIFFPSFLTHRVRPVFSGVRKSLVIWATGPKFT